MQVSFLMLKWIDLPPIWLLGSIIAAWWISVNLSFGLSFGGAWAEFAGGLFVGGGLILMLLAVYEMRRKRTTVIPHLQPSHLVSTGIFARTRNPIYLGDVLVLTGLILRWDAVLALALIPVFISILNNRFIIGEEDRLRTGFGEAFTLYCQKVRRWI